MIVVCYFILIAFGMQMVPKKALRLYGLLSALLIAYISYYIVVPETADLARHFQEIDYYRAYGWKWFVIGKRAGENIGTAIVFFLASFLPDNHWFAAAIAFLSYGLLYDLIIKVYQDNALSQKWLTGAVLFVGLSFNYYLLIFAVRLWVVFVIFSYCLYIEQVRNKHRLLCWFVYVFLVLFHYATIILVALRMMAIFLQKDEGKAGFAKKFGVVLLSLVGIVFVMQSSIGALIFRKIDGYRSYSVRGTWQTVSCWGRSIGIGLMVLFLIRIDKRVTSRFYYNFLLCIIMLMVFQIRSYQITLRFADCLVVSAIPVLPQIFTDRNRSAFCVTYPQLFAWMVVIISVLYTIMFDYKQLTFAF